MGRTAVKVSVRNYDDRSKSLTFDALVDTGATFLTLPNAWRDRLGPPSNVRSVSLATATQALVDGDLCGPAVIQLEDFPPYYGEVLFVDMEPKQDGRYEPLLGHTSLELSRVGVDTLGQRLIDLKHFDLR